MNNKVLVLKTVNKDMKAYGGFEWPKSGKIKCPDWNSEPKCGNGFHGLLWGEGDYDQLLQEDETRKWLVLEVDQDKIIDLDGKIKFEQCEVIYCGDRAGSCKVILERNPEAVCPGAGKEYYFESKYGDKFWFFDGIYCKHKSLTGNVRYYLYEKFHRENGPAIEYVNGDKEWYKEGKLHRLDGPACEYSNGNKYWYKEGEFHRLDGPACEWADGSKHWYKEGKLHRLDGPAIEWADGSKHWYKEGMRHRLDGPAVEFASGSKSWYKEGKLHRLDGPACEHFRGNKLYFIDGVCYSEKEFINLTNNVK